MFFGHRNHGEHRTAADGGKDIARRAAELCGGALNNTIFCIHLRHLLAPFPLWRLLIALGVALLRCVPLPLARKKNSLRILAHSHLEIV